MRDSVINGDFCKRTDGNGKYFLIKMLILIETSQQAGRAKNRARKQMQGLPH